VKDHISKLYEIIFKVASSVSKESAASIFGEEEPTVKEKLGPF
jgi:hypothetical protein